MRKLLYGALTLFLLLLAAAVFGPGLVDWNRYKPQIAAEVYAATGRFLAIEGDVSLSLLPRPSLSAEGVQLSNLPGREDPMAQLESLQMRLDPLPLLRGDLKIEQLVLDRPRILLERLEDGTENWDFLGLDAPLASGEEQAPPTGEAQAGSGERSAIRLDNLVVRQGTLIYRDLGQGIEERLEAVEGELVVASPSGPFSGAGRLMIRNVPVAFQGSMAQITAGAASPLSLQVGFPNAETELRYSGSLILQGEKPELRGSLQAMSANLADLLRRMEIWNPAPEFLGQRTVLRGEVRATEDRLDAPDLRLELGEETAMIALSADLGPEPAGRLQVAMQQLNLDRLLAAAQAPENASGTRESQAGPPTPGLGTLLRLPERLAAEMEVSVEALIYRDRPVRRVQITASLADEVLTLRQGQALLPGGADLVVDGALRERGGEPQFDGRLEMSADNLRGMLEWLGLSVEDIPGDRLRRMTLFGDLTSGAGQVTLSDLTAEIDTTRVTGGIAMALRARPAFGIGLSIDNLNLDAYRPEQAEEAAQPAAEPESRAGTEADGTPPAEPPATVRKKDFLETAARFLSQLPPALRGFDANFDMNLGSLALGGARLQQLTLDATLHNGGLDLRSLAIGDLDNAGGAELSGRLDAGAEPSFFDLYLDLDLEEPVRLAAERDFAREEIAALGPIDLDAHAQGTMEQMDVDFALDLLGGRLEAVGKLTPAVQEGNEAAPRLLETGLDLEIVAEHPDLAGLFAALPEDFPEIPLESGALNLTVRLVGIPQQLSVETLSGRIGPLGLSGVGGITTGSERPSLRAELETGPLPLTFLQAFLPGSGEDAEEREDKTTEGGWSTRPFGLAWMEVLDAQILVNSESWEIEDRVTVANPHLDLGLEDRVIDLRALSGDLLGGSVTASGRIDSREDLAFDLGLEASGLDSRTLFALLLEEERITGPLSLAAELQGQGGSPASLVASLAGEGRLAGRLAADLRHSEEETDLLGFWSLPRLAFQDPQTAALGLLAAFPGVPGALSGGVNVEAGVVRTQDLRLEGGRSWVEVTGAAELPSRTLDLRAALRLPIDDMEREGEEVEETARPYLAAHFQGPVEAPRVALSGRIFDVPAPDLPEIVLPDYLAPLPVPELQDEEQAGEAEQESAEAGEASPSPRGNEALRRVIEELREAD